jgi:hypothetical protein
VANYASAVSITDEYVHTVLGATDAEPEARGGRHSGNPEGRSNRMGRRGASGQGPRCQNRRLRCCSPPGRPRCRERSPMTRLRLERRGSTSRIRCRGLRPVPTSSTSRSGVEHSKLCGKPRLASFLVAPRPSFLRGYPVRHSGGPGLLRRRSRRTILPTLNAGWTDVRAVMDAAAPSARPSSVTIRGRLTMCISCSRRRSQDGVGARSCWAATRSAPARGRLIPVGAGSRWTQRARDQGRRSGPGGG